MAREIERKFLVKNLDWQALATQQTHLAQGYLNDINQAGSKSSIRIRIEGEQANINIKSLEIGMSRDEYEYPIDLDEAKKILKTLCVGPVIEKIRYLVPNELYTWEIDVFLGDNEGLIVAEIELDSEDASFQMPDWLGAEVTEFKRYYNISLSQRPYQTWTEEEQNVD